MNLSTCVIIAALLISCSQEPQTITVVSPPQNPPNAGEAPDHPGKKTPARAARKLRIVCGPNSGDSLQFFNQLTKPHQPGSSVRLLKGQTSDYVSIIKNPVLYLAKAWQLNLLADVHFHNRTALYAFDVDLYKRSSKAQLVTVLGPRFSYRHYLGNQVRIPISRTAFAIRQNLILRPHCFKNPDQPTDSCGYLLQKPSGIKDHRNHLAAWDLDPRKYTGPRLELSKNQIVFDYQDSFGAPIQQAFFNINQNDWELSEVFKSQKPSPSDNKTEHHFSGQFIDNEHLIWMHWRADQATLVVYNVVTQSLHSLALPAGPPWYPKILINGKGRLFVASGSWKTSLPLAEKQSLGIYEFSLSTLPAPSLKLEAFYQYPKKVLEYDGGRITPTAKIESFSLAPDQRNPYVNLPGLAGPFLYVLEDNQYRQISSERCKSLSFLEESKND